MESILGLERIEFELLEKQRVEGVMNREIPRIAIDSDIKSCLTLLIDHPFLCVESDEGFFEGILTRRSVLMQLNQYTSSRTV